MANFRKKICFSKTINRNFACMFNEIVVLFIAVLLQLFFNETFTVMLLGSHCCGFYLANSQVSVYKTIGPLVLFVMIILFFLVCHFSLHQEICTI